MIATIRDLPGSKQSDRRERSERRDHREFGLSFCAYNRTEAFKETATKDFDVSFFSVLQSAEQLSLFVESDPKVLRGTPKVKGTRIPVHRVLNAIEEYGSIEATVKVFPSLSATTVQDVLRFAANVLESPVEHDDPDTD